MILCVQSPRALPRQATESLLDMRTSMTSSPNCTPSLWDPTKDLHAIASNFCYLDNSGWYWGSISAAQAHAALQGASEGAFLVRDSSHPMYMLTLSVRTARGPTSVRIQYSGARFLLDSNSPARPCLLSFPDVPSLVQHYMGPGKKVEESKIDEAPTKASQRNLQEYTVLLKLKKAVHKPQAFPSLQHLSRLTINKHTDCPAKLPLPRPLVRYLQEYPFQV